jgi:hypothetical protein
MIKLSVAESGERSMGKWGGGERASRVESGEVK